MHKVRTPWPVATRVQFLDVTIKQVFPHLGSQGPGGAVASAGLPTAR